MNRMELSDTARNNKLAMIAHLVDAAVMTLFCVFQAPDGRVGWLYALIVAVIGLGPVAVQFIFWRRDHETPAIKHLVAICFAVFYTFVLFTATNHLIFLFVIPMLLVISVYNDAKYVIIINIGTVLESLLVSILGARTGRFGYSGIASAVLQVTAMILIGIFSYFTARVLHQNSSQKVQNITEAQSRTEQVLDDISELSQQMKTRIEEINRDTRKLQETSLITKNAMQEVTTGTASTTSNVQNQLLQTEAIQEKVEMVGNAATDIAGNMHQTLSILENGKQDVALLVQKVDISVRNGEEVAEKLKTLDVYMEEMNSIVTLIKGITDQTSLLALNASIEAARAGEAGKGFAIVATEITKMATQTNDATIHITELIDNVSAAITEVVGVIHHLIAGINEEKLSTANTASRYDSIQVNTIAIRDHIDHLVGSVTELKKANHVIVDSIQTISSISEEVAAHAAQTMEAEEENTAILDKITGRMQELTELSSR